VKSEEVKKISSEQVRGIFLASKTKKDIAKNSDNLVFFILVGTAIIRSF